MQKKYYIALPFIYPVCPLSIDHARMYIIGDIIARHARDNGLDVFFPVASHYSGNTAQTIAKAFKNNGDFTEKEKTIRKIYRDMYETPQYIMEMFTNPLFILDYYSQATLWELKSLYVSCDYENFYTTQSVEFSEFVQAVFRKYQEKGLIKNNQEGKQSLDYDNPEWKISSEELIKETQFLESYHQNNVLASLENIKTDWSFLRTSGYGVSFEGGIIDPMFDSELFTVFSIFHKYRKKPQLKRNYHDKFFVELFESLESGKQTKNSLINEILNWLPSDVFICEEHLKNWVVKRAYAESALLAPQYSTQKYFVTGMGLLNEKRMSASKGNAILTKDLINNYGPTRARLIILLTGGHPSKIYHYDKNLPEQANKLLKRMQSYISYLITLTYKEYEKVKRKIAEPNKELLVLEKRLEKLLINGSYRNVLLELGAIIPKKYNDIDKDEAEQLQNIYMKYLGYLLPSFQDSFEFSK